MANWVENPAVILIKLAPIAEWIRQRTLWKAGMVGRIFIQHIPCSRDQYTPHTMVELLEQRLLESSVHSAVEFLLRSHLLCLLLGSVSVNGEGEWCGCQNYLGLVQGSLR